MTDAMIQEELASYLSDADRKTESPDTSFINSPSQTIPTENSSITNLKGFYNADIGNQLNQDALHQACELATLALVQFYERGRSHDQARVH